jgi:hypothetical protein
MAGAGEAMRATVSGARLLVAAFYLPTSFSAVVARIRGRPRVHLLWRGR